MKEGRDMAIELVPFDAAEYITEPEDQAELLAEALATGDRGQIAHALGVVARARGGLGKLAEETGLQRQALYKALSADGNPRLDTFLRVLSALGVTLKAERKAA
jgi:probable addiction module antidote protein